MTGEATTVAAAPERRPGWTPPPTTDWLVAGLSFSAGLYEALAFLTFGKVFTAFQTGNLVFLGLGVAGTRPPAGPDPQTVGTALLAFFLGCAFAAPILGEAPPGGRRWPGRVVAALAISLVVQVAYALVWVTTDAPQERIGVLVLLGAFSMGMQMSAVRALDIAGVSSTAFTATLALVGARAGGHRQPAGMTQRLVLVLVALVVGAYVGTVLLDHAHRAAPLVALVVELVVVLLAARHVTGRLTGP